MEGNYLRIRAEQRVESIEWEGVIDYVHLLCEIDSK